MTKYRDLDEEQKIKVRESYEAICKEKGYGKDDRALIAFLLGITDEIPRSQSDFPVSIKPGETTVYGSITSDDGGEKHE